MPTTWQMGMLLNFSTEKVKANKQNSLATDGTGTKFPTVDAVNAGLRKDIPIARFIVTLS